MLPSTPVSCYQHVCFILLVHLFSVIKHSYSIDIIKWIPFTATSCSVLYCTYGYLLYRVPVIHFHWFMSRLKISVSMDISVLRFYGYIGDISVDIFT